MREITCPTAERANQEIDRLERDLEMAKGTIRQLKASQHPDAKKQTKLGNVCRSILHAVEENAELRTHMGSTVVEHLREFVKWDRAREETAP